MGRQDVSTRSDGTIEAINDKWDRDISGSTGKTKLVEDTLVDILRAEAGAGPSSKMNQLLLAVLVKDRRGNLRQISSRVLDVLKDLAQLDVLEDQNLEMSAAAAFIYIHI